MRTLHAAQPHRWWAALSQCRAQARANRSSRSSVATLSAAPAGPGDAAPAGWPVVDDSPVRLDALLTRCGYCSRSEARDWLAAGRVRVRGQVAHRAADKAPLSAVAVDGEALDNPHGLVLLLHKPLGVVCSHDDKEGRRFVDLLPQRWQRRVPQLATVGRLDKDTSGVLLVTDSGLLVHSLTAPGKHVAKRYAVHVDSDFPPHAVQMCADGSIVLDGKRCAPAVLQLLGPRQATLTLTEGRYHQIKRMCSAMGCQVTQLHREAFGPWSLEGMGLMPGEWAILPPIGSAVRATAAATVQTG
jgi:16S rRNA pseudouridine516 synthase